MSFRVPLGSPHLSIVRHGCARRCCTARCRRTCVRLATGSIEAVFLHDSSLTLPVAHPTVVPRRFSCLLSHPPCRFILIGVRDASHAFPHPPCRFIPNRCARRYFTARCRCTSVRRARKAWSLISPKRSRPAPSTTRNTPWCVGLFLFLGWGLGWLFPVGFPLEENAFICESFVGYRFYAVVHHHLWFSFVRNAPWGIIYLPSARTYRVFFPFPFS